MRNRDKIEHFKFIYLFHDLFILFIYLFIPLFISFSLFIYLFHDLFILIIYLFILYLYIYKLVDRLKRYEILDLSTELIR